MFCPKCGAQNFDVAPRCVKCGADLDNPAAPEHLRERMLENPEQEVYSHGATVSEYGDTPFISLDHFLPLIFGAVALIPFWGPISKPVLGLVAAGFGVFILVDRRPRNAALRAKALAAFGALLGAAALVLSFMGE